MSWDVMFRHEGRQESLRCVMGCHVLHAHGAYPVAVWGMGPLLFLPLLQALPDSHIPAWWRCPAYPNRRPGSRGTPFVIPGLVPGIHAAVRRKRWREIPGTSPGMTGKGHDGEGSGRRLRTETRCVYAVAQAGGESSSVLPASSKPYPSASCMSFLHPVSSQSVPFFPPPGLTEQRDPDSRVSCARLRRRGRVSAPARFAHLIARARQMQGAPRLSAESGSFRMRAGTGGEAASRMPLPCSGPNLPQIPHKSNSILELIQKF